MLPRVGCTATIDTKLIEPPEAAGAPRSQRQLELPSLGPHPLYVPPTLPLANYGADRGLELVAASSCTCNRRFGYWLRPRMAC